MNDPTATERKRRQREREAAGLKRLELWAKPKHHAPIRQYAEQLKDEDDGRQNDSRIDKVR